MGESRLGFIMRGLLITALALYGFVHSVPAAMADAGTITGGTANSTWTQGSVDNMSVSFSGCGQDGSPTCEWYAAAVARPAAIGCPGYSSDPFSDPNGGSLQFFWLSPQQTANGSVSSGSKTISMNGAYGQRVCLYLIRHFTGTGAYGRWLETSKLLEQPPTAATPTPTPEATPTPTTPTVTLTEQSATQDANEALIQKFGSKFTKGKKRKVACEQLSATTFECKVSWISGKSSYKGRVIVSTDGYTLSHSVDVKKKKK